MHSSFLQRCVVFYQHASGRSLGAFAGAIQSLVATPVDLLKIRLQVQESVRGDKDYVGPARMMAKIIKKEGPKGLITPVELCIH